MTSCLLVRIVSAHIPQVHHTKLGVVCGHSVLEILRLIGTHMDRAAQARRPQASCLSPSDVSVPVPSYLVCVLGGVPDF